ncbi:MAG: nucleoside recognition protein [Lachnospiraceae bacterium]|nr:nucleoside recognition protein [Lachnospiraceae bacterium]MDE7008333.1 nucleoside recognition protein [Lachnospiraceae bacterium]
MLNYIWAAMIILGVIFGAITGSMKEVTEAALDSAGEAVSLCITMAGVMALWVGLMEVAEKSGLLLKLTNMLSPFVSFMFPRIPKGHKARDYISTNIIANILGLGWACTPAGLKAMEELAKLEEERGNPVYLSDGKGAGGKNGRIASNEMCTFLILNISSLQLIPVNMIAYRQQYGSVNPAGIIAPAIAATLVSTMAAVVYCKVKDRRRRV